MLLLQNCSNLLSTSVPCHVLVAYHLARMQCIAVATRLALKLMGGVEISNVSALAILNLIALGCIP